MNYRPTSWVKGFPAEITICDRTGFILELNNTAEEIFKEDGGSSLLGSNMLNCHPEPSRTKLAGMLETHQTNVYFNTEKSKKRFFFQSPWYKNDQFAGFVEISFEVPGEIPNFIKE
jgi:transcriptional regulator with PAS, ATPase and Fis domain